MRFEYRHYIVRGSDSRRAAEASECAAEQNRFWEYHDHVFANQGIQMTDIALRTMAQNAGLDVGQYDACLRSGRPAAAVSTDIALGDQLGVSSTPTLFVNGIAISNPFDFNAVDSAVQAALASQ